MLQAEEDFIEQFARVLLVQWCIDSISMGHLQTDDSIVGDYRITPKIQELCLEHAVAKGWIGKTTPKKVLAKGFSTAAAFLKR
jgi:hypothetical protein